MRVDVMSVLRGVDPFPELWARRTTVELGPGEAYDLLALPDLALSTGSACSSATPEPSHVLLALGLPEPLARASLRFGLGRATTAAEVEFAAGRVIEAVRAQRGR